jgi:hypothetical protein
MGHGSPPAGDETIDYWFAVLDRDVAHHERNGRHLHANALQVLKATLDEDVRDERDYVHITRHIAYKRLRINHVMNVLRGRRRGRASHRRVGSRLAAMATSAGDPEPPRRRISSSAGGAS